MIGNKKDKEVDYNRLNDLIRLLRNVAKILFVLGIVALVYIASRIIKDWGILSGILSILKIISPLFIGIIIAWLLDPAVGYLQRKGASRTFATVGVFIVFIALIILFFYLVIPTLGSQIQDVIGIVPKTIEDMNGNITSFLEKLTDLYDYDFMSFQTNIYDWFEGIAESVTVGLPTMTMNLISSIITGGLSVIIGLFIAFYMLFDFNNVRKELINFLPKRFHHDTIDLTDRLNSCLKSYVQGTLFVTLILFTIQSIGFTIAGLKAPLVFGAICAILNIIPYIGPYIGGAPAVLVGFAMNPVVGTVSLIAVVISQLLESYVLTPIVMSRTMKLHPVTIIIGLLIFGNLFGMIGMILSTPIISCLKIILNFYDEKYEIFEMIKK